MKKNLVVIQEEISDCGVCSLLSIIRYYGGNESLENLRIDSLTTKDGVNAYNLIECAKKHGFDAKGIKSSLNEIHIPCIAHININESLSHFIVIYKITNSYIMIMDPSKGMNKISLSEFKKMSSNIFIELVPKYKFSYKKIRNTSELKFKSVIKKYNHSLLKIIILNIIFIILTLISSSYINMLNYKDDFFVLSIFFIIINILINLLSYSIDSSVLILNNKINKQLLFEFLSHIFKLPLKYIHIKDKNEIIKRVEEIEIINNLMSNTIINSLLNIMVIVSIIIIECFLFIFNLIPILFLIILSFLITILSLKKIKSFINESIVNSTNYKSCLINYISNINSIYHSNSTNIFLNILNDKLKNYFDTDLNSNRYISKIKLLKSSISTTFILLTNLILIYSIINNDLSISIIIIINYLNSILSNTIDNLTNTIPSFYYCKSILNKVNEFYNIEELNSNNKENINNYDIDINNLYYEYNEFNKPIKNLNLSIKSGEKVLIKGSSGCGKSTLFKILTKEYLDYRGFISLGNNSIKNLSFSHIANIIYYSSQDEYIFIDTIKNNITMHNDYSETEINKIINITSLNTILNKKSFGINTFLYSGGEELSGGERQLILLARALISNKRIIILDESLSEINEDLEDSIIDNIINYYRDRTIIYVSHRSNKNYPLKTINVEERSINGNSRK